MTDSNNLEKDYDELPIHSFRNEILQSLRSNPITILIGETGSGKTTQIPKFLIDSELIPRDKMIAITQPRRIAAISVAKRVSEEIGEKVGGVVGYSVRFDDCYSESRTKAKYMTDGILIKEFLRDRFLSKYSVIMLDEAHERSLNTDLLLGLLKECVSKRKDLKVLITSATLNEEKFRAYFNNCPVLHVPGRSFPVDIYHSKSQQVMTAEGPASDAYVQSAIDLAWKIHCREKEGHILVFLTGQDEIERACRALSDLQREEGEKMNDKEALALPLYAALSPEEQLKVFLKPEAITNRYKVSSNSYSKYKQKKFFIRKIVFSTNIAETSLTVPHIRFVIDSGFVKQKVFDPSRGMDSLIIVPISKTSAIQRAGRAGRTNQGQCYRLYSSTHYDELENETTPEIQRTNLSNTVLYLKSLNIKNVLDFDFLDSPSKEQISNALIELHQLQAIDNRGDITLLGRKVSNFPLDPPLSRCLVESVRFNCSHEVSIICALLSSEQIWLKPKSLSRDRDRPGYRNNDRNSEEEEKIQLSYASLRHSYGDLHTLWRAYTLWGDANYDQRWCRDKFLNYRALKTARSTYEQLLDEIKKANLSDVFNSSSSPSASSILFPEDQLDKILDSSLDRRISYAFTSGYFMNSALACNQDYLYKILPLTKCGVKPSSDYYQKYTETNLAHLHPSSSLNYYTPAEYIIFREFIQSTKLFLNLAVKTNQKVISIYQNSWKFVEPRVLSGEVSLEVEEERNREEDAERKIKKQKMEEQVEKISTAISLPSSSTSSSSSASSSTPQNDSEAAKKAEQRALEIEKAKQRFLARKNK